MFRFWFWQWGDSALQVPTVPGLEYTFDNGKAHTTFDNGKAHCTFDDGKAHYTFDKDD